MGYGIIAFAVDLPRIRSVIGARDERLAEELGESFGLDVGDNGIADLFGEPDPPTALDGARQMVLGEPYDQRAGFAYGYFFEHLCERYGSFLPNNAWYPCTPTFVTHVDEILAAAGVPKQTLAVENLIWGGAPVTLPLTDFPSIGWLPRTGIDPALQALMVDRGGGHRRCRQGGNRPAARMAGTLRPGRPGPGLLLSLIFYRRRDRIEPDEKDRSIPQ
jgi:hypothetical protein